MVRICHLSTVHTRRDVRIIYKECISLSLAGFNVHCIFADGLNNEDFEGITIHGSPKYPSRLFRMILSPVNIFIKALSLKAKIYHFHDMELLPVGFLLRILGYRVIYDVHDNLPKQIMGKHYIAKPLRYIIASLISIVESVISPWMSAIVTADNNKKKRFDRYHTIVRSVHNYPLLEELDLVTQNQRDLSVICYIGGITKIRGVFQLLDAIRFLDVKLIIAGKFEPANLECECRKHPSWSKVEYRGFVDRVGVANILSTAGIGMVTLLPNENYLDSLPIKMFEYMSAGMPVIASDFPDWRVIVSGYKCGLCVNPTKPSDISKAITTLILEPLRCKEMGDRGRNAILNDLNWNSQAEVLIKLYQKVVEL